VLEQIVGRPTRKRRADRSRVRAGRPVELVEDVDFGGLSLKDFAQAELKQEHGSEMGSSRADGCISATQSIDEFDKELEKFEDLHRSITACDQVLKSVEVYLQGFQADLGSVSTEIETLQTRSTEMNSRLENRRVVEKLLGPAVEDMSLSPIVVKKIVEGQMDEGWIKALAELEKRVKVIEARSKDQSTKIKAVSDLQPLLENLKNRAAERIRDYLVAQIKALRSPSINAQIIQQQGFLKYKDLYAFLACHQPQLAEGITLAYVNTMRWYYLNHFTRYDTALKHLKLHTIDKNEVVGSLEDPSSIRRKSGGLAHDAFSLGRRMDILKKGGSHSAISSYAAEEDKSVQYMEIAFHSFNLALIDNASFEYTFLSSFFSPAQSFHAIARTFDSVFGPTFALGQALTKSLIDASVDALGILLCVRLNQHFAFELQRRKVPAGESYVNATNMLLWPRFQMAMSLHCDSLRRAASSAKSSSSASSILTSNSTAASTAPHPLTQRFASFLQGLLALSSEAGDDEPVAISLGRLRDDFEAFLRALGEGMKDKRRRDRFLANNYSLVGTIIEGTSGKLAEEMRRHFDNLKDTYSRVDR
jgi:vacuolar protein sorting-associated protein 52